MFKKATRERIRTHKWSEHSNQTQFFKRIRDEIHLGIKDITLAAKELPEKQLEEIFTVDKIRPLVDTLLKPRNKRTALIAKDMTEAVYQKLVLELPNEIVNGFGSEIGKTYMFASILAQDPNKPLRKKRSIIDKD